MMNSIQRLYVIKTSPKTSKATFDSLHSQLLRELADFSREKAEARRPRVQNRLASMKSRIEIRIQQDVDEAFRLRRLMAEFEAFADLECLFPMYATEDAYKRLSTWLEELHGKYLRIVSESDIVAARAGAFDKLRSELKALRSAYMFEWRQIVDARQLLDDFVGIAERLLVMEDLREACESLSLGLRHVRGLRALAM